MDIDKDAPQFFELQLPLTGFAISNSCNTLATEDASEKVVTMRLAVLPMSVKNAPRASGLTREQIYLAVDQASRLIAAQSGLRVQSEFRVLSWVRLPYTSEEWNSFGFRAGERVKPIVAAALGVDLSVFTHFALVIDKTDSTGAALASDLIHIHVGAQSLSPSLLAQQLAVIYGAASADVVSSSGVVRSGDAFCIMGSESVKYAFNYPPLTFSDNGVVVTKHSRSGPGMCTPNVAACGWLYEGGNSRDLGTPASWGSSRINADISVFRGAWPDGGGWTRPTCLRIQANSGAEQFFIEWRQSQYSDWDLGLPDGDWLLVHLANSRGRPARCELLESRKLVQLPERLSIARGGFSIEAWLSEGFISLYFNRL